MMFVGFGGRWDILLVWGCGFWDVVRWGCGWWWCCGDGCVGMFISFCVFFFFRVVRYGVWWGKVFKRVMRYIVVGDVVVGVMGVLVVCMDCF